MLWVAMLQAPYGSRASNDKWQNLPHWRIPRTGNAHEIEYCTADPNDDVLEILNSPISPLLDIESTPLAER